MSVFLTSIAYYSAHGKNMAQKGKRELILPANDTEADGDSPAVKTRTEKGHYYIISGMG